MMVFLNFNRNTEPATRKCIVKDGFLENLSKFTRKYMCWSIFFQACHFIKKETPTRVFFCSFSKIFRNSFFTGHLRKAASGNMHDCGHEITYK